jgi:hypothetical protein
LHDIGLVAQSRAAGKSAEEYIYESIVDPTAFQASGSEQIMPAGIAAQLPPADLLNVTALLSSQGGELRYGELLRVASGDRREAKVESVELNLAAVEQGRQLFFGRLQCGQCHDLYGSPTATLVAPSLAKVGMHTADFLRDSVLSPSRQLAGGYEEWLVTHSGLQTRGRRLPASSGSLRLLCTTGEGVFETKTFDTSAMDLEDGDSIVRNSTSPMPSLDGAISADELTALIGFLRTLR